MPRAPHNLDPALPLRSAIILPLAVMIHALYTLMAAGAVMGPGWLPPVTFLAVTITRICNNYSLSEVDRLHIYRQCGLIYLLKHLLLSSRIYKLDD